MIEAMNLCLLRYDELYTLCQRFLEIVENVDNAGAELFVQTKSLRDGFSALDTALKRSMPSVFTLTVTRADSQRDEVLENLKWHLDSFSHHDEPVRMEAVQIVRDFISEIEAFIRIEDYSPGNTNIVELFEKAVSRSEMEAAMQLTGTEMYVSQFKKAQSNLLAALRVFDENEVDKVEISIFSSVAHIRKTIREIRLFLNDQTIDSMVSVSEKINAVCLQMITIAKKRLAKKGKSGKHVYSPLVKSC